MRKLVEQVLLWVRWLVGRAHATLTYGVPGQSMVEYGIVITLIAIVAFGMIQLLGTQLSQVFQNILNRMLGLPS